MDDIKLAMLGNREAVMRIRRAGVLVPCAHCGGKITTINLLGTWWARCMGCDATGPIRADENAARLAWNTRAPILSAEEFMKLEEIL